MTIPAWLLAKIGPHRAAHLAKCGCGAPLICGLDADNAAILARCDPTPIDEFGEAIALMNGRPTYDLTGDSRRKELEYRYEWSIKRPRKYSVLAAHKCGTPPLSAAIPAAISRVEAGADPPF